MAQSIVEEREEIPPSLHYEEGGEGFLQVSFNN